MSTMAEKQPKLATPFAEFCKALSMGKTKGYEEVRRGALVVRKLGKRTVVTAEDGRAYIESLPKLELPAKGEPLSEHALAKAIAAVRARSAA